MREQDWPDEAREAAIKAHAEARNVAFPNAKDERAVAAVFAALAPHVTPTAPLREELVDAAGRPGVGLLLTDIIARYFPEETQP